MGILFDYFAAPTDAAAAAVIDRPGGPAATYPTVADTGIDPEVQCGTLEELLTGRSYDEISEDPRWGEPIAAQGGGERLVQRLTDGLLDALAGADAARLAEVAVPWAETEEFWGQGDPEVLAGVLVSLSALVRDARVRGESVYCYVTV
jgi:hypothetical protein